jgi:hypothetical protein
MRDAWIEGSLAGRAGMFGRENTSFEDRYVSPLQLRKVYLHVLRYSKKTFPSDRTTPLIGVWLWLYALQGGRCSMYRRFVYSFFEQMYFA